ncbi:hypothetical protein [Tenacibaculum xiamenense]|uniref:hypothetical protein n=1 Tax=Tenacibaculum xiamenense TaxID=1261553 RepID=UPI003894AA7E
MTDNQFKDLKFALSKLSLKLGGINTDIQTSNTHLEKTSTGIDKVVSILERGFQSLTLTSKVSKGVGVSGVTSQNTLGKAPSNFSVPPGMAFTISKPIEPVTEPEIADTKGKGFKLTPIIGLLSKLEKAVESPRKAVDKLKDSVATGVAKIYMGYDKMGLKFMTFQNKLKKLDQSYSGVLDKLKKNTSGLLGKLGQKWQENNKMIGVFAGTILTAVQGVGFTIKNTIGKTASAIGGVAVKSVSAIFSKSNWWKGLKKVQGLTLKSIKAFKKKIESISINPKKMFNALKDGMGGVSKEFGKGVAGITNVKSGLEGMSSLMKSAGIESSGLTKAITGVSTVLAILSTMQSLAAAGQWAMSAAQWAVNVAMGANPIGLIIVGIIGLITVIGYAWDHFEGFRGTIMGMWEVIKSFGSVIKEFIINRIKGVLSGITGLGSALVKLFSGDFSGAWKTAKKAVSDFVGVDDFVSAGKGFAKSTSNMKSNFDKGYKKGVDSKFRIGDKLGKMFSGKKTPTTQTPIVPAPTKVKGTTSVTPINPGGSTIKIDTLVKELTIKTTTLRESTSEIKQQVKKVLLEALQDTQTSIVAKPN